MSGCTLERQDGKDGAIGKALTESLIGPQLKLSNDWLHQAGAKDDSAKLRWGLLPWSSIEEVLKVMEFGAKKYSDNGWKEVASPQGRYLDALTRHLVEIQKGHATDSETGLSHMAHIACNALFLLHFEESE